MTWKRWTRVTAQAHLTQVMKLAKDEGPQVVTFHGRPVAVIVDYDRYVRICQILETRPEPARGAGDGPPVLGEANPGGVH